MPSKKVQRLIEHFEEKIQLEEGASKAKKVELFNRMKLDKNADPNQLRALKREIGFDEYDEGKNLSKEYSIAMRDIGPGVKRLVGQGGMAPTAYNLFGDLADAQYDSIPSEWESDNIFDKIKDKIKVSRAAKRLNKITGELGVSDPDEALNKLAAISKVERLRQNKKDSKERSAQKVKPYENPMWRYKKMVRDQKRELDSTPKLDLTGRPYNDSDWNRYYSKHLSEPAWPANINYGEPSQRYFRKQEEQENERRIAKDNMIDAIKSRDNTPLPLPESYTLSELNEAFNALGLNTEKYTTEYLAEELGFVPLSEYYESPADMAAKRTGYAMNQNLPQPKPTAEEYETAMRRRSEEKARKDSFAKNISIPSKKAAK